MIEFFLARSTPMQMLVLAAHAAVVLLIATGCMRWLGSRLRERGDLVPVAPYFVSITTLYALFLAFHASTIWSRQHEAETHFRDAVSAISRLASLLGKEGADLEPARLHLSRYAQAVVRDEWASGNARASPHVSAELETLRAELVRASGRVPTAFGNHLWRVFDDVVRARSERLWIGMHSRGTGSWTLVLVLGLLSHIAIGFVHADRPRAGGLALVLFAFATTAAYWLLTRTLDPFANLDTLQYLQASSSP